MLYLKNTLGGLSRSLTDSALNSFQGPHRWWKLALFAALFVLPGGSVGVAVLAWIEHRRARKGIEATAVEITGTPVIAASAAMATSTARREAGKLPAEGPCQRGDAACRAAAGKLARQTRSAEKRV